MATKRNKSKQLDNLPEGVSGHHGSERAILACPSCGPILRAAQTDPDPPGLPRGVERPVDAIPLAEAVDLGMPEKDLQAVVNRLLQQHGWLSYHTWSSKNSEPGFPDVVAIRGKRLLVAELKSKDGKVTDAQRKWLDAWRGIPAAEVWVWRPADLDEIERTLSGGAQ